MLNKIVLSKTSRIGEMNSVSGIYVFFLLFAFNYYFIVIIFFFRWIEERRKNKKTTKLCNMKIFVHCVKWKIIERS